MDKKSNTENVGEIRNKIYAIRDRQVMLDCDLAKIYGYTTKAFNQQVKNNIEKFEGEDFMFRLTEEEVRYLSRSNFLTSMQTTGIKGGRTYFPYAFTEQGVYMLMTVLKGKLAIRQSRALVMAFKAMKDYIVENREVIKYRDSLQLALQTAENIQEISLIKNEISKLEKKLDGIDKKVDEALDRTEITNLIQALGNNIEQREYILMDGKPMNASEVYINIYKSAKKSIHIIDNYVDIRTLRHLQKVRPGTKITIFTDNLGNYLHKNDYENFQKEYPGLTINFIKTNGRIHDRFIVLDCDSKNETVYHSGASEKDGGGKMSAITKISDNDLKEKFKEIILDLNLGPKLILK